jgi:hypothetical protein
MSDEADPLPATTPAVTVPPVMTSGGPHLVWVAHTRASSGPASQVALPRTALHMTATPRRTTEHGTGEATQ